MSSNYKYLKVSSALLASLVRLTRILHTIDQPLAAVCTLRVEPAQQQTTHARAKLGRPDGVGIFTTRLLYSSVYLEADILGAKYDGKESRLC
ncbi:hypothetical protein BaRGS_00040040 [Batillaria attramentaria]|uniref:Secreted protein n=1 Tax=Batillaria attramentaria TaxID=370345 RepID=A0ABD0J1J2_9CAEN